MDQEINKNHAVTFFLSTDSKETNEKFLKKYEDRIIHNEEKTYFNSICQYQPKYNQDDAVIDLFLLSKTNKIIGSNWSSFSYLSSKMSNIQLVIAGR
jgi:protein-arginine kinase